jgi:hypothetical protein
MYTAKEMVFMIRLFRTGILLPNWIEPSIQNMYWRFKNSEFQILLIWNADVTRRGDWRDSLRITATHKPAEFISVTQFVSHVEFYTKDLPQSLHLKPSIRPFDTNISGDRTFFLSKKDYKALGAIWEMLRYFASHNDFILEAKPDYGRLNSQCTFCGNNAVAQCALGCGTPYCGQACANDHYKEHFNRVHA